MKEKYERPQLHYFQLDNDLLLTSGGEGGGGVVDVCTAGYSPCPEDAYCSKHICSGDFCNANYC